MDKLAKNEPTLVEGEVARQIEMDLRLRFGANFEHGTPATRTHHIADLLAQCREGLQRSAPPNGPAAGDAPKEGT